MKNILKWTIVVIVGLVVILFGTFKYLQSQTKKSSPEQTVEFKKNGTEISVFYNRPYKKGRKIFGGLVPYDTVWRTGANEATTFTTNKDLEVDGKKLPAGKYTLWTIPGKESWVVIFNGKQYGWGVNFKQQASREPEADVLQVTIPSKTTGTPVEQFTISFPESNAPDMSLAWDQTQILVPIK
jgi:uncharacterized membrane protein